MARIGAAYGKIDWASADIRHDILTVPLRGETTPAWTGRLAELAVRVGCDDGGWRTVEVARAHVKVAAVRPGAASDLHEQLERIVAQANAEFAAPPPAIPPAPVDHGSPAAIAGSLALVLLAAAALALQWSSWDVPVRAAVVVAFVVIGPGWAVLRLWGLERGWEGLGLVVAVSLALAMAIAGATVYADRWSPLGTLCALAAITVLAALTSLAGAARRS